MGVDLGRTLGLQLREQPGRDIVHGRLDGRGRRARLRGGEPRRLRAAGAAQPGGSEPHLGFVSVQLVQPRAVPAGVVHQLPEGDRAAVGQQIGVSVRLAVQPRTVVRGTQRTGVRQRTVEPLDQYVGQVEGVECPTQESLEVRLGCLVGIVQDGFSRPLPHVTW